MMSDIRLERALSKEFLLLETLEVDEVDDEDNSDKRLELLSKLVSCMDGAPFT